MDTHKNAPLTPKGREAMVRSVVWGGLSKASAARQFNVTPKTVAKWFGRFRADGPDGLTNRGTSYAPAMFAEEPEAKTAKCSKEALAAAMRRLFTTEKIKVQDYGPPSHRRSRLVIVGGVS
jgi:transposase